MERKELNIYILKFAGIRKILIMLIFVYSSLTARSQEVLTVITNQNGSPPVLKLAELKSIFMGERQRWKSGTKITIALMKTNTPVGKNIAKKIYDMSGDELNKFWLALVFQGKAQAPNFFNSSAELENYVSKNPGAIGILDQVAITGETRTVLIEGKKSF